MDEFFENIPQTMVFLPNRSDSFAKALYTYNKKDYYEAVYHAGESIKAGDTHEKVLDLMSNAAIALYEQAPKMSGDEASEAYELLINTTGVPEDIISASRVRIKTFGSVYEEVHIDNVDLIGLVPNSNGEIEMDYTNADSGSLAYFVANEEFKALLQANPDIKFLKTNLDNLQVILPIGILPTDQSFNIVVLKVNEEYQGAISSVYELYIQKTNGDLISTFNTPVTLKFVINPKKVKDWDNVRVAYINEEGVMKEYIKPKTINKETGEIIVEVSHFSKYGVVEIASTGQVDNNNNTGTDTNNNGSGTTAPGTNISVVSDSGSTQSASGSAGLPSTATNSYNILFIGMVLITAGGFLLISRKKKIRS